MSITFGSVGDIISVCMLIKGLVKCLDDSRGSSIEYQAVIRELHSLDHALLEVELVFLSNQGSQEMFSLQSTVLSIAAQCEKCVTAYREKVKGYKRSLQPGGSGSFLKDSTMKLRWPSEKEHLTKFRAEIMAHCLSINMLLVSAGVKATQISDENQQRCFKRIKQDQDQSLATQQAMLDEIKIRLDKNSSEVKSARIDVQTIASGMRYVRRLGSEILSMMQNIWSANVMTYKAIITLQSQLPRQLERTWTQSPVILKDALGRTTPVHLEFVETFEIFQTVLEMRFDQLPGHRKVQRKEYALSTEQSEQEIDSALAFRRWFRPGQEVDMNTPSRKRKHRDDPEDEDEPRHFCRVRLISYRNRTRKEAVEQPQPEANGMDVYGMDGGDIPGDIDVTFGDYNSNQHLEQFDFDTFLRDANIMGPDQFSFEDGSEPIGDS
ncbi:MAG: hypothetical protein L6R38_003256 [Xanthoria sp. 2 TBL-2021]|nr:MAG: hypothetical protein L6R38_003256 [Xanthoria sp. 2 TBL-2021]